MKPLSANGKPESSGSVSLERSASNNAILANYLLNYK